MLVFGIAYLLRIILNLPSRKERRLSSNEADLRYGHLERYSNAMQDEKKKPEGYEDPNGRRGWYFA